MSEPRPLPRRRGGAIALLIVPLLLGACASPPPPAPPAAVSAAERHLLDGNRAFRRDDYPLAARHFNGALTAYAALDDPAGMVAARLNLAETASGAGNLAAVAAQLAAAAHTLDREGDRPALAPLRQRHDLLAAALATRLGEWPQAERLLTPLLPAAGGRCPDPLALAALADRSCLALARGEHSEPWIGRLEEALAACGAAEALAPGSHAIYQGRLARFRALLARRAGEGSAALAAYGSALEHYRAAAYRPGIGATLTEWGELLLAMAEPAEAEERLGRALVVRAQLRDRAGVLRLLEGLTAAAAARGDHRRADLLREWELALADEEEGWERWWRLRREGLGEWQLPYR